MSTKDSTITSLNQVKEFHQLFKAPVLAAPQIPSESRSTLRVSLIQEELDELKEAISNNDITEVADALVDLQYVLNGAILEFGLQDKFEALFNEVHRSNMSKACQSMQEAEDTLSHYATSGTNGYIEEREGKFFLLREGDNKVLKSINYSKADLNSILNE